MCWDFMNKNMDTVFEFLVISNKKVHKHYLQLHYITSNVVSNNNHVVRYMYMMQIHSIGLQFSSIVAIA